MENKNCTKCKYFSKVTGIGYSNFDGICNHTKHIGELCNKYIFCSEYEYDEIQECLIGIMDTETKGKKFAIGTKNHTDTFVLNFNDRSCLLFMGDIQPVDLRQFNFDEFTAIEINGNKFVKESNNV